MMAPSARCELRLRLQLRITDADDLLLNAVQHFVGKKEIKQSKNIRKFKKMYKDIMFEKHGTLTVMLLFFSLFTA